MEISEKEWNDLLKKVGRLEYKVQAMFAANRAIIPSMRKNIDYLLATEAEEQRAIDKAYEDRMRQINRLLGGED